MKAKRILTDAQRAALAKNAAKGRKKLAQMRKAGLPIGKAKQEKLVTTEFPLAALPVGKPPAVPAVKRRFKKEGVVVDREGVDGLAQLIVATWAEFQRRKGTL